MKSICGQASFLRVGDWHSFCRALPRPHMFGRRLCCGKKEVVSRSKRLLRSARRRLIGVGSRLDFGLVVVVLLPIVAVLPLLQPGLPRTADGFVHLLRVVEVDQSWGDGVYYPRWAPDMVFGYGYPIFNYFAPLLYHITSAVHLIGLGFESAFKVVLIGCLLLGTWGTYALTKDILGPKSAVLAAVAYVYAPFTLREIYVRGGYAQFLAVSLMPVALWSASRLITRDSLLHLLASPLLCGAVVVSHNISGMFFFPVLAVYMAWIICTSRRWHKIKHAVWVLVLALALVSFFVVPALVEKPLVKLHRSAEGYLDFHEHFLTLEEILSPSVTPDSSSFNPVWLHNLGAPQVLFGALGVVAMIIAPLTRRQRMQAAFFVVVLSVAVFMTLRVSAPLWEHVPLLAFTQFPWRLLDIAGLTVSVLAGLSVHLWSRLPWRHSVLILLTVSLVVTVVAEFVHLYEQWPPVSREQLAPRDVVVNELRTGAIGTTSAGECLPKWVAEEPSDSPLVPQYLSSSSISKLDAQSLPDSGRAELTDHTVVSDEYRVVSSEPFTVQFNTFYFPGWQASVDSEPVRITPSYPQGLITFEVPAGEHTVVVRFEDTPVRVLANVISVGALVIVVGVTIILVLRRRNRDRSTPKEAEESRLSLVEAGLLALPLLILLVIKEGYVDPYTTWFRMASPPEQVLGVQHAARVNLDDEVMFLGYDIQRESVTPGDTLYVTLYWEAERRRRENYSVFVHLDDLRPNYISWSLSEEINPANIPTSTWTPGFYVSDRHALPVSVETPPGLYVLRAGLYRPDTGQRLAVLDEEGNVVSDSLELARVRVRRTRPVDLSEVAKVGPFEFGERIRLLGYELQETSATPGNYFRLLLYWEGLEEMTENYTVFVHLVDDSGQMWAQADGLPANGMYPTWAWLKEEIVEDEHLVLVGRAVPSETYHLAIGVYELETLQRLEVTNSEGTLMGDQILLPTSLEVLSP
ncbi:MAG: hypothetical protein CEE40_03075 [Chloroflexi bacterium B3_Chlor]|nr:MAG: hypothetical protein CEE40_03075 [Chloroflexi bacterium B3_Chlor]